jgi:hypothetical protein
MKKRILFILALAGSSNLFGQTNQGNLTGNIESTFQYLNEDTLIKALQPPSKGLLNTYMNVFYTYGNFKAGMRVESYLPRIQGYPAYFDGTGIGMRYVGYANDFVDVTVGSFYEQFGSGLTLRAYEDRALGYDNMLDGVRLIVRPFKGVIVKGVYGYQRYQFTQGRIEHGEGIVRGFDGEIHLNEALPALKDKKLDVTFGGSFASKYQSDDQPNYILPENVGCYGGRLKVRYGKITFDAEYVTKGQDPSQDNGFIYNKGQAVVANLGFSQKGLGILLQAKSTDNMSYRSDRNKKSQELLINYIPSMNKTHTYNLVSSLYPYATQLNGEVAYQAEVLYTLKKGSLLGGKYGTTINANYSTAFGPLQHTSDINPLDSTGVAYTGRLFDAGSTLYWRDINFNISKKFSKNFNVVLSYFNIILNNNVASVTKISKPDGLIESNIVVAEVGYKFKKQQSIRVELQGLFVKDYNGAPVDKGDWATAVVEYTINSNWFVSVMDQYNFGNEDPHYRAHHPYLTVGYIREATRITASYGRQRAGMFCVGGVCRQVPASNGLTLSFTQSF